jgi:cysteine-rich CPXCG protein
MWEEPDMNGSNGNGDHDPSHPDLDEEFPLGDGPADLEALVDCPYCGESVELTLDPGSGPEQDYVEDCEVCCQPWQVSVRYDDEGHADVSVTPLTE